MSGLRCRMSAFFVVTVALAGLPVLTAASAAQALTTVPGDLAGVSAASSSDAWAVGESCPVSTCSTLAMHWNGSAWSKVATPSPGFSPSLDAVADVSATDAWAVGSYCPTSACAVTDTLILHWNGTAWSKVSSPSPSTVVNYLFGVAAVSSTDAWAVGYELNGTTGPDETMILHWNGTAWSRVKTPDPSVAGGNFLNGVTATSPTSAFAVGSYDTPANSTDSLILRWNGTAWSKVKSPDPSATFNQLGGVSATSASSAWTVGQAQTPTYSTLLARWNGTAWSKATAPKGTTSPTFTAVAADSATDAWLIGQYCVTSCSNPGSPIDTATAHWTGTAWSIVASPSPSATGRNLLSSVSAVSPSNAWAVGGYPNGSNVQTTLILHWNGKSWKQS